MKQSILIIDDDPDMGELICAVAQDLGLEHKATTNAAAFMNALGPKTTLIFLDLLIPEMDGIELLRLLAQQGCKAGIVLMSGIGKRILETADELAKSLGLAIVGHLYKPFVLDDLEEFLLSSSEIISKPVLDSKSSSTPATDQLRIALDLDQFKLHYQPQIDIETGSVAGLEALVRWQQPGVGLVFPDEFIPQIEAMGAIDRLGWLVIKRACREIRELADLHRGIIPSLSINASVQSLMDLKFPDTLLSIVRESGISEDKLKIEITESGLIVEMSETLDVLVRLRMKGIGISIDDFGMGYSMMQQLRRIPAVELKIDKIFVQGMRISNEDRVIVAKTIEIGHALGMKVVAEGVETAEQLSALRQNGCDIAQGYLFSRPLPLHEIEGWLKNYSADRFAPR